jgi:hypothetical protein
VHARLGARAGTYAGRSKLTVNDQIHEHMRSATRGREVATVRNYEDALRPVPERLGPVPLAQTP